MSKIWGVSPFHSRGRQPSGGATSICLCSTQKENSFSSCMVHNKRSTVLSSWSRPWGPWIRPRDATAVQFSVSLFSALSPLEEI